MIENYHQPTIVIDNFFETPNQVREWALSLNFYKGNRGNWPGYRTDLVHLLDENFHELVCRKIIKHTSFNNFKQFDISFSLCNESWESGWIHTDPKEFNVVGLVYLSPNPPTDKEYGTIIYDTPTNYMPTNELFVDDVNQEDPNKRQTAARLTHNSNFTASQTIENRFNRCLIFDARQWHSGGNFFGSPDNKREQRLTMVFFGAARW
jgi:hypothetical protein